MIAGGGTGGHVIPALAIAGALKSGYNAEVCFLGTSRGMETRLIPQAGYALELIDVGQLNRVSLATQFKTLVALPRSILHCFGLLRRWKPQVVVGVGGYASGPGMLAALIQHIPTLAFEPNAIPGMANRLIGKRIRAAAVNFAPTLSYFRNAELTGIPVRAEFFCPPAPRTGNPAPFAGDGREPGRTGTENQRMPEIAATLLDAVPGLTILHQAGARHAETTQAAYAASGAPPDRWKVQAFLGDMPAQFAASDLILARSGASTVAELAASGKPALLVPFPQAADDHQRKNAEVLVEGGAASMLLEQDMSAAKLLETITSLLGDREKLSEMAVRARTFAHPQAAARIAEMVAALAS